MLDARHALARLGRLKADRTTHDSAWQEVADYMIPARSFNRQTSPGAKRNQLIFNTHPVLALEQLAGGLHGMLTSPALRWFALRPAPDQARDRAVAAWFEAVTDIVYSFFQAPSSGFNVALHESYLDLSGFGSSVIFTADRGRRGPRYRALPLSECYAAENGDGEIDTLYRDYQLPVREVLRLWPDTAPARLRKLAETRPDDRIAIVHATEPHPRGGWSTLWSAGADELETARYQEFPFTCARWTIRSGETAGTGPGVNALPDVKMLNKLEEVNLRGLAKAVDPASFLPHDGFLNSPNMNPGAINYYESGPAWRGQNPIFTMPHGQPQLAEQKIDQVQDRISGIFYVTWLRLPQQPNMTATEVLQRRDELLRLLGPMVSRLEAEKLGPLLQRTVAILSRNGLLPPAPAELRGGYTVEWLGPLSRAQRQADAETVMRWLASMQPLMQVDPSVVETIDAEATARFLADRSGAPALLVRTPQQIAERRAAAAEQQAMLAQAQTLRDGAAAAKDGSSALATLAGISGGMQ